MVARCFGFFILAHRQGPQGPLVVVIDQGQAFRANGVLVGKKRPSRPPSVEQSRKSLGGFFESLRAMGGAFPAPRRPTRRWIKGAEHLEPFGGEIEGGLRNEKGNVAKARRSAVGVASKGKRKNAGASRFGARTTIPPARENWALVDEHGVSKADRIPARRRAGQRISPKTVVANNGKETQKNSTSHGFRSLKNDVSMSRLFR